LDDFAETSARTTIAHVSIQHAAAAVTAAAAAAAAAGLLVAEVNLAIMRRQGAGGLSVITMARETLGEQVGLTGSSSRGAKPDPPKVHTNE
jgi:hypothetical protein